MSRVIIDSASFRRYRAEADMRIQLAVNAAAEATAVAARAAPTDYDIQHVLDSIEATPARRSRRGYAALVIVKDWKGIFFEKGTYARRGRARSSRAKAVEGSRGVKPVRMLRKGMKAGKLVLIAEIQRAFR